GGQVGVVTMGRFIAEREKLHSNLLGRHVDAGNWITGHTLTYLTAGLAAKSAGIASAAGRAVGLVNGAVRLPPYALTFEDAFRLIAWTSVFTLIAIATLRRYPLSFGDLGRIDRGDFNTRARSRP